MFRVEFVPNAQKALRAMPRNTRGLILSKIEALALMPFESPNVRKLKGRDGWRLRVGDWRVIYTIDVARQLIVVLTIATRGEAYR